MFGCTPKTQCRKCQGLCDSRVGVFSLGPKRKLPVGRRGRGSQGSPVSPCASLAPTGGLDFLDFWKMAQKKEKEAKVRLFTLLWVCAGSWDDLSGHFPTPPLAISGPAVIPFISGTHFLVHMLTPVHECIDTCSHTYT